MKIGHFAFLFLLFVRINIAAEPGMGKNENGSSYMGFHSFSSDLFMSNSFIIDESDTVVFDLSLAVLNGSFIDIPVYVLSDDSVFSLDFSLKYNHSKLEFDTIFDNVNYLQSLSFYNTFDSTIRYTSSSFQNYGIDTALVSIRFNIFSGQIRSEDLNNLFAYLNGSSCSIKVINSLPTFIYDNDEILNELKVFPNPANDVLNINSLENISVQLLDVNYRQLVSKATILAGEDYQLIIQKFKSGIYYLRIFNENYQSIRKIVIER